MLAILEGFSILREVDISKGVRLNNSLMLHPAQLNSLKHHSLSELANKVLIPVQIPNNLSAQYAKNITGRVAKIRVNANVEDDFFYEITFGLHLQQKGCESFRIVAKALSSKESNFKEFSDRDLPLKDLERLSQVLKIQTSKLENLVNFLKANDERMLLPTYIPSDFEATEVEMKDQGFRKLYKVLYRNKNNPKQCFGFRSTFGSGGPSARYYTIDVKTQEFGVVNVSISSSDTSPDISYADATINLNNNKDRAPYEFILTHHSLDGKSNQERFIHCQLSVREVVKVVSSLKEINY